MAKQGTSTAVPRLRFPEFREAAAWKEGKLEELIDTISPPAKLQSSSYLATGKFPIIDQSQDAICGWTDDAQVVVEGPLPLIVFGDHTCTLKFVERPFAQGADGIKILTSKSAVSIEYLFHSLNHRPLVMEDYKRHFSTLKERRVFFPSVESGEQQKIANCLTSLDEVIAAQGRKVEALKAHKRGLMQQLFPREGETRPRLRFPEFRNAPDWQQKALGEIANVKASGDLDSSLFSENRSGDFLHPVYSNAVERNGLYGYYSVPQYPGESVTITARGTLGIAFFRDHEFMGIGRLLVVSDLMDVHPRFLTECWNHLAVISNEVTSIPQLTAVTARATNLPIPSIEEQSRIADCLSSLDTQITAESSQLAALKTHKQGLMQQLFPSLEGAK